MTKMISVPIKFRGNDYYSLIRFLNKEGYIDLRVTIMNGDLERALLGKNVFQYKNGYLIADLVDEEGMQRELQTEILNALDQYLGRNRQLEISD
jgi:hypothetical protein